MCPSFSYIAYHILNKFHCYLGRYGENLRYCRNPVWDVLKTFLLAAGPYVNAHRLAFEVLKYTIDLYCVLALTMR